MPEYYWPMYIDFSGLFHQSSKDRSGKGRVNIPVDPSLWPPEWKTVAYKEYPRFDKIALEQERPVRGLFDAIQKRTSRRDFDQRPIEIKDISALMKYSCGIVSAEKESYHRAQPSGGSRYPIEVYPVFFVPSEKVPAGVYHYNVKRHALDALWERTFTKEDISALFTYSWAQNASFALILTGVFRRNQMKYGERGYRQILIEAGAIVQNIYLTATDLGIKCCAIDGVHEPTIEKLLDIDGVSESAICSLVLG
jgi:SagB-type dehydrogenase family enzyme